MGNTQQVGWAEAVVDGVALETALGAAFASNFYPPLDGGLVDPTAEAIRLAVALQDDPEALADAAVVMPDGLSMYPRGAERLADGSWIVQAMELLDATRAWVFVSALALMETENDDAG